MKKSKAETAATRQKIIATAAQEFQRNGIHATGLADLMEAAGLTHGGFYRHFESKDQLVAEACSVGMSTILKTLEAAAAHPDGRSKLQTIIEGYLGVGHRDDCANGCPLAGLGSELARADPETREAVSEGFCRLIDTVASRIRRKTPEAARSDAIFAIVAMVGAVTMSRIVTDPALSAAILRDTEDHLLRR